MHTHAGAAPRADTRSPLATAVAALVALGLVRVAARSAGLVALLGVVIGCVAALTIGVLLLRLVLLH